MQSQTRISTIRHASTEFNAQRRYAGSIDVALSEQGVLEARAAAQRLNGAKFDLAITSPLKRATQTAQILVGDKAPIAQNELCTERKFGVMEGLTWDEIRSLSPPVLLIQVGYDLHTVNPKGAEPFEDVWQRAKNFRKFLFDNHKGREILVVSHGVFLQLFNGLLRGLSCIESLAFYPGNLELVRFEFEGEQLVKETTTRLGREEIVHW